MPVALSAAIARLVQVRTVDAGVDQDQPTVAAHRDGIAPDPLALPDPHAVRHVSQHSLTPSGVVTRHDRCRSSEPACAPEERAFLSDGGVDERSDGVVRCALVSR
jgi:hypothetical protein